MIPSHYFLFGKMKPCSKFLSTCRNLTNFSRQPQICPLLPIENLSNFHSSLDHIRIIHSCPFQLIGFRCIFDHTQKNSYSNQTSFGQSRVRFGRNDFLVGCIASGLRNCSSKVNPEINDKNFDNVYLQEGVDVKPLVAEETVIEGKHLREEKGEAFGKFGDGEKKRDLRVEYGEREESEIEKEAWRLLRNSVVTYCNNPVGTVAANDPNDKLPLNYDQVFVRDFIPSALAFLMKGEGEIVKNFLLYNLQLQVPFTLILL